MGKVNDMYLKEIESMSDEEREKHHDEEDLKSPKIYKSPELVRMYSLWTEFIKSIEDRFEEKKTK